MTQEEINRWACAYIEIASSDARSSNHPLWWAIHDFMVGHKPAEDCWRAIIEIVRLNPPKAILGSLAAGPLEDLIHYHGMQFIDRIEHEARLDPDFRHLLVGVWESSTPEVWVRIQRARGHITW